MASLQPARSDLVKCRKEIRFRHIYVAMVLASLGDREPALRSLETSERMGWRYALEDSLPDIAEEPAFRRLRGLPRFEALAARQRAWVAKERREIAPLLAQLGTP